MNRTRFACALAIAALAALLLPSSLSAQITFQRAYGGSDWDWGHSVHPTADGGYIVAGYTESYGAGSYDAWLVKTDAHGDTLWTKTVGGWDYEQGYSVQQTTDGGYIIAGYTASYGAGGNDVYLIRTNGNGDTLWTRTYGGPGDDWGYSVQQTTDGGYVVAGGTLSYGAGSGDIYLVKTNASGDSMWSRTFGGANDDGGHSVQQTTDGSFTVAGYTRSFGAGRCVYLVKTDSEGDTLWTRIYGGTSSGEGYSVQQTADSGYVIACCIQSPGPSPYVVGLIKTDANGDSVWARTYGSASWNAGYSAQQTSDGGYIVTGVTEYFNTGYNDVYLVKTDRNGDTLWTRCYGDSGDDEGECVDQASDGGYIIAGYTRRSGTDGPNVYLIKTDSAGNVAVAEPKASPTRAPALSISCEPNPSSGTTRISLTPQVSSSKPLTLRMYDSQGRMVLSREVSTSSFPLSTSDLPSGAYFMRLDAGDEHATARLVLQH